MTDWHSWISINPVMVGVVSSIPTMGNFIFFKTFQNPLMSILYGNARSVLKTKTSNVPLRFVTSVKQLDWFYTIPPFLAKLHITSTESKERYPIK